MFPYYFLPSSLHFTSFFSVPLRLFLSCFASFYLVFSVPLSFFLSPACLHFTSFFSVPLPFFPLLSPFILRMFSHFVIFSLSLSLSPVSPHYISLFSVPLSFFPLLSPIILRRFCRFLFVFFFPVSLHFTSFFLFLFPFFTQATGIPDKISLNR